MAVTTLVPGGERRLVTRDIAAGTTIVEIADDQGTRRFDAIGLEFQSATVARYTIKPDDPLSARAEVSWAVGMRRGDWRASSQTRTVMTSTATEFRLHATLDAFEGDDRVFSREWNTTIPRDHV